jgi:hypothetical protein
MAHWAEIDQNNIVTRVLVGDNNEPDEGYQWLVDNLGGRWIKTSYNTVGGVHYTIDENEEPVPSGKPHLRYNFAGIGFTYDEQRDAFIPLQPEEKETLSGQPIVYELDEDTCTWLVRVVAS